MVTCSSFDTKTFWYMHVCTAKPKYKYSMMHAWVPYRHYSLMQSSEWIWILPPPSVNFVPKTNKKPMMIKHLKLTKVEMSARRLDVLNTLHETLCWEFHPIIIHGPTCMHMQNDDIVHVY